MHPANEARAARMRAAQQAKDSRDLLKRLIEALEGK